MGEVWSELNTAALSYDRVVTKMYTRLMWDRRHLGYHATPDETMKKGIWMGRGACAVDWWAMKIKMGELATKTGLPMTPFDPDCPRYFDEVGFEYKVFKKMTEKKLRHLYRYAIGPYDDPDRYKLDMSRWSRRVWQSTVEEIQACQLQYRELRAELESLLA
tara:strand:- start:96 stop:578 length:483 start_codon:yes stop_codon:yes gene_type:complete